MFRKEFKDKGLYDARVGYIGGEMRDPGYRAVCGGGTGRMSLFPCLALSQNSALQWVRRGITSKRKSDNDE